MLSELKNHGLGICKPALELRVDFALFTLPNCNYHYSDFGVVHFVDKAVSRGSQFDFVYIRKAVQFAGRNSGILQPFLELLT